MRRLRLVARVIWCAASAIVGAATVLAQSADPRITIADVEKVTGLAGLTIVAPRSVPGAGPGVNFAGSDRKMILMVNFGTADLYRRARAQTEMKVGNTSVPMKLFHADVPGIGDEAFDSPPGPVQYVLYLRKGEKAASLTTYLRGGKPVLTTDQLRQLGALVAPRL